ASGRRGPTAVEVRFGEPPGCLPSCRAASPAWAGRCWQRGGRGRRATRTPLGRAAKVLGRLPDHPGFLENTRSTWSSLPTDEHSGEGGEQEMIADSRRAEALYLVEV